LSTYVQLRRSPHKPRRGYRPLRGAGLDDPYGHGSIFATERTQHDSSHGCCECVSLHLNVQRRTAHRPSGNVLAVHEVPKLTGRSAEGFPRPSQATPFIGCVAGGRKRAVRDTQPVIGCPHGCLAQQAERSPVGSPAPPPFIFPSRTAAHTQLQRRQSRGPRRSRCRPP
jgi:hypothetical protein